MAGQGEVLEVLKVLEVLRWWGWSGGMDRGRGRAAHVVAGVFTFQLQDDE